MRAQVRPATEPTGDRKAAYEHSSGPTALVSVPSIALSKAGGAIRGMGEKFTFTPWLVAEVYNDRVTELMPGAEGRSEITQRARGGY